MTTRMVDDIGLEPMTFRTSISQVADNKQDSRANSPKNQVFTHY